MFKLFLFIGSLSAGLSVIAGAFGSHALAPVLREQMFATFETAVRYHMYHALAIIGLALALRSSDPTKVRGFQTAGWLFVGGTLLFSGSLYLLALTDARWLGAVTPIGGLMFIAGWAATAVTTFRF
jgi:uncharacterized membrane protein YgdD (TMEM256/DUF423 family)